MMWPICLSCLQTAPAFAFWELCVGDIAANLEMSQTAISHQLRILKQNHLIKYRREGKNMIYALADDHVKTIINCAIEHIEE